MDTTKLLSRIKAELFGIKFKIVLENDKVFEDANGLSRKYLQCKYISPCTDTGEISI